MKNDIRKKICQLIVPRLDGALLTKPSYFKQTELLVDKGIGGFILFGGKKEAVKKAVKNLQESSEIPLFIASDLEQGLGQQVDGGTIFPRAMAIGSAIVPDNRDDLRLLRDAIGIIAYEARDVGINVILAPVLDVNTNPKNPIICTRAFSEDPSKVAFFGREFIKGIQAINPGLIACGKHFPGHGDTEIDSHIELPVIKSSISRLKKVELPPFIEAIKSGVKMIMAGHLLVEAIDPENPASLSSKVINGLLRKKLGFNGMVITDAMNMGALKRLYGENESCLMAIKAGADIILHPDNPESVMEYLSSRWKEIEIKVEESLKRILKTKERIKVHSKFSLPLDNPPSPPFGKGGMGGFDPELKREVAQALSDKAIKVIKGTPQFSKDSVIISLDDDNAGSGKDFINALKKKYPQLENFYIDQKSILSEKRTIIKKVQGIPLVIGIFSNISAWKGRSGISPSLFKFLKDALRKSGESTVISFGCPYILDGLEAGTLIAAYWDSAYAQKAVGKLFCGSCGKLEMGSKNFLTSYF